MLGTVVLFFFACLLPFKILTMWVVLSPIEILEHINIDVSLEHLSTNLLPATYRFTLTCSTSAG